jgi:hypothetical protein
VCNCCVQTIASIFAKAHLKVCWTVVSFTGKKLGACHSRFALIFWNQIKMSLALTFSLLLLSAARSVDGQFITYTAVGYNLPLVCGLRCLCAVDQPMVTLTPINQLAACGLECMIDANCIGFNYNGVNMSCDIYHMIPGRYVAKPGCQYYQVSLCKFSTEALLEHSASADEPS